MGNADSMTKGASMLMRVTDYLEIHLLNWAMWMHRDIGVRGYPAKSLGISTGGASEEFDNMLEDEEKRIARITDTVINNITEAHPAQGNAIHHAYLHAVYRFSERYPYEQALADGLEALRAGLKRKGIWMGEI